MTLFLIFLFLIFTFVDAMFLIPRFASRFFKKADEECVEFVKESYATHNISDFHYPAISHPSWWLAVSTCVASSALLLVTVTHTTTLPLIAVFFLALFLAQRMSWFDAAYQILPDTLVFIFGLCGLLFFFFTHPASATTKDYFTLAQSFFVIVVCLFVLTEGYAFLRKREGLGFGDVKLLVAFVPWLGYDTLAVALPVACVTAIFAWLVQRAFGVRLTSLPFGPFLFLGWAFSFFMSPDFPFNHISGPLLASF
jgi:leader peptidase HopD